MVDLRNSSKKPMVRLEGTIVKWLFFSCAIVSILTTAGILITLIYQAMSFFSEISVWDFLTGTRWTPILKPRAYGVLPLLSGTLLVTVIAAVVALPIGLMTALRLLNQRWLYFALTFLTPQLQHIFDDLLIFNALSAGIVMGVMIIPMVSSLSEDAMIAVPKNLKEGAYALGATRYEVSTRIVVPAALSGIIAAFILALSRAIGETMLVTIAAGATPRMGFNPMESIQTMTAYIVQLSLGEAPVGSLEYNTIFAVGLLLFCMTLVMNLLGFWVVSRFREKY